MKKTLLLLQIVFLLSACNCKNVSNEYWQSDSAWYKNASAPDTSFVDVFYIASTEILTSFNPDSTESFFANLTPEEKSNLKREFDFVSNRYYPDSVNFFAPYYHQYTMNCLYQPKSRVDSISARVSAEVCEAFDYYMDNFNGGRRFIISGFSQGGQMTLALLKHMTDEQYSRMVAAYSIGFGVSEDDLKCPHIKPAENATDTGVTISFNSVSNMATMWPFVVNDAAVCINPLNWTTTAEPAKVVYEGREITVSADTINHVLKVNGFKEEEHCHIKMPCPEGCIHHYDLLLYVSAIKQNTLKRSK